MFFGMPTLIELDTLEENAKLCHELGLDFVEINMNLPQYQVEELKPERLLEYQQRYHIFFTFHLPEDLDIAHLNDRIRQVHQQIVFDMVHVMKKINSPILNMHMSPGIHFTLPDKKVQLYKKHNVQYMNNIQSFASHVSAALKNSSMSLNIENTGIYNLDYIQEAILAMLQHDNIKLTWDVGHDYSSGSIDEPFIINQFSKVNHMHLHDGILKQNHLELFTGQIDIVDYLNKAKSQEMSLVIETKTIKALTHSDKKLQELEWIKYR